MMRTLVLVLACVLLAAPSAADAKKPRRPHASKRAAKIKKSKKALVRVQKSTPPTRVAAAEHRVEPATHEPTPPPAAATPAPEPPPPPPVSHGPLGPQAGDDEVPGSRMKR